MPSLPEQAGPNAEIGSPMMHPSRRPVALYKKYTRYEPKDAKDGCTMEARHAFPGVFSLSSQRGDRKPLITSRMLGKFFGVWEQGRKEGRKEERRDPLFLRLRLRLWPWVLILKERYYSASLMQL